MSDTDDGFDEEAVREELREKYGDDEADREITSRMSELLLQGATMTNKHCETCQTPIFRYDGQAFCPQCQQPVQQDGSAAGQRAQQAGEQAGTANRGPGAGDARNPETGDARDVEAGGGRSVETGDARDVEAGGGRSVEAGDVRDAEVGDVRNVEAGDARQAETGETQDGAADNSQPQGGTEPADPRSGEQRPDTVDSARTRPQPTLTASAGSQVGGESVDALESSIAALARRGASADDPRTAREYLEAAREAAEALAALRRNA